MIEILVYIGYGAVTLIILAAAYILLKDEI
jgi:hypothetical protein